jgi:hypothetical protein
MARFDPKLYASKAPLQRSVKTMPKRPKHGHPVRVFKHAGHTVEIETIYHVTVDGKEVHVPLSVDNNGRMSCHAIPNYSTLSAIDMVKAVIDQFPDDFAKVKNRKDPGRGRHPPKHHH